MTWHKYDSYTKLFWSSFRHSSNHSCELLLLFFQSNMMVDTTGIRNVEKKYALMWTTADAWLSWLWFMYRVLCPLAHPPLHLHRWRGGHEHVVLGPAGSEKPWCLVSLHHIWKCELINIGISFCGFNLGFLQHSVLFCFPSVSVCLSDKFYEMEKAD